MDTQPHREAANLQVVRYSSRAQALKDGTLVDITVAAEQAGLRGLHVAMTREAWSRCVAATPVMENAGSNRHRRLWEVAGMLHAAMRRSVPRCEITLEIRCLDQSLRTIAVPLRVVAGTGDAGKPVLTLTLPKVA